MNIRQVPHALSHIQSESHLLSSLPLDCRLIIREFTLYTPHTRIERQQPPHSHHSAFIYQRKSLKPDELPYRLTTAGGNKDEKPLSLLLCCRQTYAETLKILYSYTTFVFALPQDLYYFQALASPAGLQYMESVILAYGRIDWRANGPIYDYDGVSLGYWEDAFKSLAKRKSLRHLQVWLSHRNNLAPDVTRRPREGGGNEAMEKRHRRLFEVMGGVKVRKFTVRLTWNPVDVLGRREWPFRVELQTADEMVRAKRSLPASKLLELSD